MVRGPLVVPGPGLLFSTLTPPVVEAEAGDEDDDGPDDALQQQQGGRHHGHPEGPAIGVDAGTASLELRTKDDEANDGQASCNTRRHCRVISETLLKLTAFMAQCP